MRILLVSLALVGTVAACGGNRGKIMADTMQFDTKTQKWTPLIEYKAPDIDEITGIETPDPDSGDAKPPAGK